MSAPRRKRTALSGLTACSVALFLLWLATAFFHIERSLGGGGSIEFGWGGIRAQLPYQHLPGTPPWQPSPRMAIPAGTWAFEYAWPFDRRTWYGEDNTKAGVPRLVDGWIEPRKPRIAILPHAASSGHWPLTLSIPLWMFALVPALPALFLLLRARRRRRRGRCVRCGYSLTTESTPRLCPECGTAA